MAPHAMYLPILRGTARSVRAPRRIFARDVPNVIPRMSQQVRWPGLHGTVWGAQRYTPNLNLMDSSVSLQSKELIIILLYRHLKNAN